MKTKLVSFSFSQNTGQPKTPRYPEYFASICQKMSSNAIAGRWTLFFHDSQKNWCPASTVHEQHFSGRRACKFRHFYEYVKK